MADDPVTMTLVKAHNIAPGKREVILLVAGPADYDATNGAAMDLSTASYGISTIHNVTFGAVTAKADALVLPTYVNDDFTDTDGGAAYFSWSGTAGAVLANVDDTTDLSGYEWRCTVTGE